MFHRLEERVKAHVLICMLACYLVWHLRRAWAPLTFTDENPPVPASPVAAARRSGAAQAKASCQYDQAGQPYYSFRGLLEHLATLTRNQVRFTGVPGHRADARRADQRPARGLHTHRRADPAQLEVARTPPGHPAEHQVSPGIAHRTGRNFGLTNGGCRTSEAPPLTAEISGSAGVSLRVSSS